jgi:hypothetical protein
LKVYPGGLHTIVSSHAAEIAGDIAEFATPDFLLPLREKVSA